MPGFDQVPKSPQEPAEDPAAVRRRVRLGHSLFLLYSLLYAGFMLLNAFSPGQMERTPVAGVNIAVLYGLTLIGAAFVLAIFYEGMCRWISRRSSAARESR